jgi:predicted nucleotidyltransferase component of viral defense system
MNFYTDKLYPIQDRVLSVIGKAQTSFYLTGGTASSRGYLNHRYSDDLDFFVNDEPNFGLWVDRIIISLNKPLEWSIQVLTREERYTRLNIKQADIDLKIELINDVPSHIGEIRNHPVLGRLDSPENILANKITALIGREEPKDLADIWGFACKMELSIEKAITDAQSKAAGIFPLDLARILCSITQKDWEVVNWVDAPPPEKYIRELISLGESLIYPNNQD